MRGPARGRLRVLRRGQSTGQQVLRDVCGASGRIGEPEDVARAALSLASDDATYITGHTLAVDGGYLAGGLWSGALGNLPKA